MPQQFDPSKPQSGVTTFGELYQVLRDHFQAVGSNFSGTVFPTNPITGQKCFRTDRGQAGQMYVYCGDPDTGENGWVDADIYSAAAAAVKSEVLAARGTAASLEARLDVAMNQDGTLKTSAPASGWWTAEPDTAAYASDSSFTVSGDKRAVYSINRAVLLEQTNDAYGHVACAAYNASTDKTTVSVTCAVDTGLAAVHYGQQVANSPLVNLDAVQANMSRLENMLMVETVRRMIGDDAAGSEGSHWSWFDVFDGQDTTVDSDLSSGFARDQADKWIGPVFAGTALTALIPFDSETEYTLENVRQSAVKFETDTANTSGHFEDASLIPVTLGPGYACPRIIPGCRFKLAGSDTVYTITGVAGDGSAADAVAFEGADLAAGTYDVEWVRGLAVADGALALSKSTDINGDLVPAMTGETTDGWTVTSDETYGGIQYAWYAFDDSTGYYQSVDKTCYVRAEHADTHKIKGYAINCSTSYNTSAPGAWTLKGSDDGAAWDTLDTRTGQSWSEAGEKTFMLAAPAQYRYFEINITDGQAAGTNIVIDELRLIPGDLVPANTCYTALTAESLDTAWWTDINSASVAETLSGAGAWYCLSFDARASFKVWTGASWRAMASSLAADHGGADGTWYWRDNADLWTAAYQDNAAAAISQAVDAGTSNQMDSAALAAVTDADWEAAGAWSAETDTLDLGVTLYTTDQAACPLVDQVAVNHDRETSNFEIVFKAFEADSAPASGKALVILEPADGDTVTLNTDLTAYQSLDDGASWEPLTLADEGDFETGRLIIAGEAAFTAAGDQTTRLRLVSQNQKRMKLHAAAHMLRAV